MEVNVWLSIVLFYFAILQVDKFSLTEIITECKM